MGFEHSCEDIGQLQDVFQLESPILRRSNWILPMCQFHWNWYCHNESRYLSCVVQLKLQRCDWAFWAFWAFWTSWAFCVWLKIVVPRGPTKWSLWEPPSIPGLIGTLEPTHSWPRSSDQWEPWVPFQSYYSDDWIIWLVNPRIHHSEIDTYRSNYEANDRW